MERKPFIDLLREPTLDHYGEVLEILIERVGAERGCLWLERENSFLYRGDQRLRERFPFSRQAVDSVLKQGRAFLVLDSQEDFRITRHGSIATNQVRSVLCAAARDQRGDVLALAYFDTKGTQGPFDKEHLTLLREVLALVPGAVPEPEEGEGPPIPQVAALAVVDGKVVMITSKGGNRWVLPKGHVEVEDLDLRDRVALEAMEEAGVTGTVSQYPVGEYFYSKNRRNYRVQVYRMTDCTLHDEWPEARSRIRLLMTPKEAAERVWELELRSIITDNHS